MPRRDLKEDLDVHDSIQPDDHTSTVDGTALDLNSDGPYNAVTGYVVVGDWTDGTADYQIQEKDDGGSWSAVADADLDGTEPSIDNSTDADSVFEVAYRGNKDQVRWQISSVNGMTSGHEGAAFFVAGRKRSK